MIELRDLQLLSALARHRHFAKAAQECGISQPAFSMRIRNLEDRLGVSIVRRGNRFQGLTEEGAEIVRRARRILDDARSLEQDIRARQGAVQGTLAIGVIPTAVAHAARMAGRLHQVQPGILSRIETATATVLRQRLEEGTIDAAVTYGDAAGGEGLEVSLLYEESYVLLAPDHMVPAEARRIGWAQAADLPLVLLEPGMQNRRILDRVFADLGLRPNVIAESSGVTAAMVMAREGLAATVLPQVLARALGPLERTRVLDLTGPAPPGPSVCLTTPRRQPELATVRALKAIAGTV